MNTLIRFSLYIGIISSLTNCFGVSKTFPEKRFYLIETSEAKPMFAFPKPRTFVVRKVFISPKFEGKEFVYRKENAVYESDFYNGFFIPPAHNFKEELVRSLLKSGNFEWDASIHTRVSVTHFIELNLTQLYGDFRTKEPKAVIEFEVVVYEDKDFISSPVFRKTYKQIQPIDKKEPEALVLGWNLGLSKSFDELNLDLSKQLK
ncbi:hypothetical protein ND861_16575 [Leptospira sp. 2 VSF19]|uniref:ABC-type transport auxiliary lipoprotein component domain-containing protein n=1 Tax=Leptospira soteropolitanensis TaxID=2950025 RepID=A0AAW5VK62_9LEPT|nr:hypothetical protein [Leptospira soteropolitanensis]MCW7494263.1 hypothetical protein [Leptospira soteropolitanensis]MCW7501762.1 hypothetical protein [Leptospira soteropolitanensis]MCW7524109.1 hypothetical protein [Leptospira soteropolitanensis]MCW7527974.1 hypothetical protein [Leptospira soteropolitanensis]MCW7531732.1 hypothetical protein [Leptospira soteropolitanensis]